MSGWRAHTWIQDDECIAYDDGRWEFRPKGGVATAQGREESGERAKARVLPVVEAMRGSLVGFSP